MKIIYTVGAALLFSMLVSYNSTATAASNKPVTLASFEWENGNNGNNHNNHVRVPEPATIILLGSGLVGLGAAKLFRKEKKD